MSFSAISALGNDWNHLGDSLGGRREKPALPPAALRLHRNWPLNKPPPKGAWPPNTVFAGLGGVLAQLGRFDRGFGILLFVGPNGG